MKLRQECGATWEFLWRNAKHLCGYSRRPTSVCTCLQQFHERVLATLAMREGDKEAAGYECNKNSDGFVLFVNLRVVRHTPITPNKLDLTLETCSTNFIAYYFTHIYRLFTGHEIKTQY